MPCDSRERCISGAALRAVAPDDEPGISQVGADLCLYGVEGLCGKLEVDDAAAVRAYEVVVHLGTGVENHSAILRRHRADLASFDQARRDSVQRREREAGQLLGQRSVKREVAGVAQLVKRRQHGAGLNRRHGAMLQ